jgi:homoserine dehydrogenase
MTMGEHSGEMVFSGAGAGGAPTAVAVVSDLLSIAQSRSHFNHHVSASVCVPVNNDIAFERYVRLSTNLRSNIASIEDALAKHGLKTRTAFQNEHGALVIDSCTDVVLQKALREIADNDCGCKDAFSLPVMT